MEEPIFGGHTIFCMDFNEIVAEKTRASLTRTEPAIRDFFDIWYIKTFAKYDLNSILPLIKTKVEETNYKYTIDGNFNLLNSQIETDLKYVLKKDFAFNLREIYDFLLGLKNLI